MVDTLKVVIESNDSSKMNAAAEKARGGMNRDQFAN